MDALHPLPKAKPVRPRLTLWLVLISAVLAGCAAVLEESEPVSRTLASARFEPRLFPVGVTRSNEALAQDFLDLNFNLESGPPLPRLLRFEGPVEIHMRSPGLRPYRRDLAQLVRRLRQEAEIDAAITADPSTAEITIEMVPGWRFRFAYPRTACVIIPGERDWRSFLARPKAERQMWADLTELTQMAIFLPSDSQPHDVRDCLHEEIAQAMGPTNDLYRLADSVFNDDNYHSVLTSFDMLMLRVLYSDDLRSGMAEEAVAARLPGILRRLNPGGVGIGREPRVRESSAWVRAIKVAQTRSNGRGERLRAANTAVAIAGTMRPQDHRLGVALLTRGRLIVPDDPVQARADFQVAYRVFRDTVGRESIRTARAALHLAFLAKRDRDHDLALRLVDEALPPALDAESAVLVSELYSIRAEALAALGRFETARQARLEHLKWARFAYGDKDGKLASAQAEIEAFAPASRAGGVE